MPARKEPGREDAGRKRRAPKLSADEKAAMTKEAMVLAKELNEQIEEVKGRDRRLSREERSKRSSRVQARRRAQRRNGQTEPLRCHGINLAGNPCKAAPLLKDNWDGDEDITGDYCLHHEPTITQNQRDSFEEFGSSKRLTYRKVTPSEIAHRLIQRSPQHFLRPYLRSLGLKLNEDGEVEQVGTGLKLYGYGRDGTVRRSSYADLQGQINVVEKLLDRIYGKARQSPDLASSNTTVNVNIHMDPQRVNTVAQVLMESGALPNGNGNGQSRVIEGTATDVPAQEVLLDIELD